MKQLKILKTGALARPIPSEPHWCFSKGEVIETEDVHFITRLLDLGYAKEVECKKLPDSVPESQPDDPESNKKQTKMKKGHLNKKLEVPLNKGMK